MPCYGVLWGWRGDTVGMAWGWYGDGPAQGRMAAQPACGAGRRALGYRHGGVFGGMRALGVIQGWGRSFILHSPGSRSSRAIECHCRGGAQHYDMPCPVPPVPPVPPMPTSSVKCSTGSSWHTHSRSLSCPEEEPGVTPWACTRRPAWGVQPWRGHGIGRD